jgi:cysteine desulfurase
MRTIYCDHNSTTRTDAKVIAAMQDAYVQAGANPSSGHQMGRKARVLLDDARAEIASYMKVKPSEIVLTGGGSESDNLAILGCLYSPDARGKHCVTVATEHHAVLGAVNWAQQHGFEVTILPVDHQGHIDIDAFAETLRPDTQIATVMLANNEVGTLHPIKELARIARDRGVVFHTDAVQAWGKIPVDTEDLDIDMLSLASHKFYGPKGTGILYVRGGIRLEPIIHGGGQETGRRAGTENIPGAVGTAVAMRLLAQDPDEITRVGAMARKFRDRIAAELDDIEMFGDLDKRLPNTVSVGFGGIEGDSMMIALDLRGICVSTGAACHSGATTLSHVLVAMGVEEKYARGSIRFSFGRDNVPEDADAIAEAVIEETKRLRAMSPATA